MSRRPSRGAPAQSASRPPRARSSTVRPDDRADRLSSKSSRTTRTGTSPSTCSRSRSSRCPEDRSVRPASASARAPPRVAATGCRRSAAASRARSASAETSPPHTTVTRSGSSCPIRAAISAASADLPIPPAPCSTSPATSGPASSADQRRRSADRIEGDARCRGPRNPAAGWVVRTGSPVSAACARDGTARGGGAPGGPPRAAPDRAGPGTGNRGTGPADGNPGTGRGGAAPDRTRLGSTGPGGTTPGATAAGGTGPGAATPRDPPSGSTGPGGASADGAGPPGAISTGMARFPGRILSIFAVTTPPTQAIQAAQ